MHKNGRLVGAAAAARGHGARGRRLELRAVSRASPRTSRRSGRRQTDGGRRSRGPRLPRPRLHLLHDAVSRDRRLAPRLAVRRSRVPRFPSSRTAEWFFAHGRRRRDVTGCCAAAAASGVLVITVIRATRSQKSKSPLAFTHSRTLYPPPASRDRPSLRVISKVLSMTAATKGPFSAPAILEGRGGCKWRGLSSLSLSLCATRPSDPKWGHQSRSPCAIFRSYLNFVNSSASIRFDLSRLFVARCAVRVFKFPISALDK